MVLHSPTDNTVGIENASTIFQTARHPRSFVSLEGSDHLLTGKGQAARAGGLFRRGPTNTSTPEPCRGAAAGAWPRSTGVFPGCTWREPQPSPCCRRALLRSSSRIAAQAAETR